MGDSSSGHVIFWSSTTSLVLHLLAGGAAIIVLPGVQTLPASTGPMPADVPMLWIDAPAPKPAPPPEPPPQLQPEPPPLPAPEPPKSKETALGVDDADKPSETWMGSSKPGEHAAKLSTVEQPALTRDPAGGGSPASEPKPASDAPAPPEKPEATPPAPPSAPAPEAPATPTAIPAPQPEEVTKKPEQAEPVAALPPAPPMAATQLPQQPLGAGEVERPENPADGAAPVKDEHKIISPDEPTDGPAAEPAPKAPPAPAPVEAAQPVDSATAEKFLRDLFNALIRAQAPSKPQPAVAAQPGAAGSGSAKADNDAWLSEKVADATSIRRTAQYANGTVTAGKGLELLVTRRPDSTVYTRLRGASRNPTFDIVFGREGKPKDVIAVRSSGNDPLDADIISSIFAWRAKGKDLQELADRENATLTVRLTFLLFGE